MFTEFDTDLYDPLLAADLDEADPDQLYRTMVSTQLRIRQLELQEQLRQSATRVFRPLSARLVEEYTRRGPELERQLLEGLRRILVSRLAYLSAAEGLVALSLLVLLRSESGGVRRIAAGELLSMLLVNLVCQTDSL